MILSALLTRINPKVWLVVAFLALLGYSYLYVYDRAVEATVAKYEAIERERILKQNELIDKVTSNYKRRVEEQRSENEKLTEELKKDALEAAKDPHANRPALSVDSVRRLNKIK